MSIDGREDIIE
jgi:hypothetical protein